MKIKVKKFTISDYRELVSELGDDAEFVMVPGTIPGLEFQGVYLNEHKTDIGVPWPIDRPMDAQNEFASEVCGGGFPVEFINKEVNRNGLYIVESETCH